MPGRRGSWYPLGPFRLRRLESCEVSGAWAGVHTRRWFLHCDHAGQPCRVNRHDRVFTV